MNIQIPPEWKEHLQKEYHKPYFTQLTNFVRSEYASHTVYPPAQLIFHAFQLCPFSKVRVVILGQDPYHEPNQAHGLCFSVKQGVDYPPSLRNILKELNTDVGTMNPLSGDLSCWAHQGVLLLNSTLTVRAHQAGSHQNKGWENFTNEAIRQLATLRHGLVFILWGAYAQQKGAFIDSSKHLILKAPHPSPLSSYRGFFGSNPFSKTNEYLTARGEQPIDWNIR